MEATSAVFRGRAAWRLPRGLSMAMSSSRGSFLAQSEPAITDTACSHTSRLAPGQAKHVLLSGGWEVESLGGTHAG